MLTCASMFSGAGLADLGCAAAGYQPVAAVECSEEIAQVYVANLGDHCLCARVEDVDYRPWSGIDMAWCSPACIRASVANQSAGEAEADHTAAEAVSRMIVQARPRFFVLENVSGYASFRSFALILETLRVCGYAVAYEVVNSADYGVPQTRRRLILRARDFDWFSKFRVICLPTKRHWRDPSDIALIEEKLASLARWREVVWRPERGGSIYVPRLGCGLGVLSWAVVRPLMERYLVDDRFVVVSQ